jgi:aerobic-type carbon monoxide dehydrogenase small subunit (CoxS/CutS family)
MPHPMLQHQTTTTVLELLHMDLTGPMQVESLGGKRYTYVLIDGLSRYTWINFIRDLIEEKVITLEHVATEEQLADIFTKTLDAVQFKRLRGKLGICLFENL